MIAGGEARTLPDSQINNTSVAMLCFDSPD